MKPYRLHVDSTQEYLKAEHACKVSMERCGVLEKQVRAETSKEVAKLNKAARKTAGSKRVIMKLYRTGGNPGMATEYYTINRSPLPNNMFSTLRTAQTASLEIASMPKMVAFKDELTALMKKHNIQVIK